jgi:hypothetical protein
MSEPKTIIDAQVQHLLGLLDQHRSKSCEEIQHEANEHAGILLHRAHAEARKRIHEDNARTRIRMQWQITSTDARLQTKMRLLRQQSDEALLSASWALLTSSLNKLWQHGDSRKTWIDNIIALAKARLISGDWIIEHPADWDKTEMAGYLERLEKAIGHRPTSHAMDDLDAGIRICTDTTCVDGTLSGLLRDQQHIEALMLTAIHSQERGDHG